MTGERRRLMDATIAEIIQQEGLARELAEFAFMAGQDGHHAVSQVLRQISRHRRVKGMELRGNLAVLREADRQTTERGE